MNEGNIEQGAEHELGRIYDMGQFVANLGRQVHQAKLLCANKALLTDFKVEAKIVLADAEKVIVVDPSKLIELGGEHYTTVSVQFAPESIDEEQVKLIMPLIIGCTRDYAERQLQKLDIAYDIIEQPIDAQAQYGVVITQFPLADIEFGIHDVARVVIGCA
ncbi:MULTISPECIES: hypothetical protein [unclassified Moritella]|uniref:hypothetical protein n=1 Tax=unclassified Moritella TaxID=2637987 RepID=UPI001BABCA56|nr:MULTISPECIES: hypothetical protein [unclassified Moritella]QUM84188.1 hypothetical protein HWV02_06400 [Moritella sp. 28]QUM88489.1 hypothetical protein HWV03_06430 [Moritella sp. 36]